jgi:methyltransferase
VVSGRQGLFLGLLALVVAQRLVELRRARHNRRRLLARGGVEVGAGHYPVMVALHACFLVAAPAEVLLLDRQPPALLVGLAGTALAAAMALRVWVLAALGERWTTRIVVLPGAPLVAAGPFRFLRHPNYLAVRVEIAALPLIGGAYLTALAFSLANALLLRVRIRVEERALGLAA